MGEKMASEMNGRLIKGTVYGAKAQDIYDMCCVEFGWDESKRGKFAPQQPLFGRRVTVEKYSVWFICHHDKIDSPRSFAARSKQNYISGGEIVEVDHIYNPDLEDTENRVTFLKTKSGYEFFGVVKLDQKARNTDNAAMVRRYVLESGSYPY